MNLNMLEKKSVSSGTLVKTQALRKQFDCLYSNGLLSWYRVQDAKYININKYKNTYVYVLLQILAVLISSRLTRNCNNSESFSGNWHSPHTFKKLLH